MQKQYVIVARKIVTTEEIFDMSAGQIAAQIAHACTGAAAEFGTKTENVAAIILEVPASSMLENIQRQLKVADCKSIIYKDDSERWLGWRSTALVTQVLPRDAVFPILSSLSRYAA